MHTDAVFLGVAYNVESCPTSVHTELFIRVSNAIDVGEVIHKLKALKVQYS